MWPNPQFAADLVTFTEEILNGKLPFFVHWYVGKLLSSGCPLQNFLKSIFCGCYGPGNIFLNLFGFSDLISKLSGKSVIFGRSVLYIIFVPFEGCY